MNKFYCNLISFLTVLSVNIVANTLPINNQTTGEIVNKLPVLFMPSTYVFSIWGLIYILIGIWVFSQLHPSRLNSMLYQKTSKVFVLSCLLNSLWVLTWHYEHFLLSVLVIISLLVTLIIMYKKVRELKLSQYDFVPFSIYLGWISVATILNIRYYLVSIEWDGFGLSKLSWTIILLFIASAIAVLFMLSKQDKLYPLLFAWSFIGTGVKNLDENPFLSYLSFGLSICLVFSLFLAFKRID